MGRLYCIMGKSAVGKDSIFRRLCELHPSFLRYVMYSTRPIREGETDGVTYHFTDEAALSRYRAADKVIESRTYQTVMGPWTYATVDDGQIDLSHGDYLILTTLEAYRKLKEYFGETSLAPIYLETEDRERLLRSIGREAQEGTPNYSEVCRRFLADEADFSEAHLRAAGIKKRYRNDDLERCAREILSDIEAQQ